MPISFTEMQVISTHTLTWSVTLFASISLASSIYFNSHAHVERDMIGGQSQSADANFNSHAHVERDRTLCIIPEK